MIKSPVTLREVGFLNDFFDRYSSPREGEGDHQQLMNEHQFVTCLREMCTDPGTDESEASDGESPIIPGWELVRIVAPSIWKTFATHQDPREGVGLGREEFVAIHNVLLKGSETEKVQRELPLCCFVLS